MQRRRSTLAVGLTALAGVAAWTAGLGTVNAHKTPATLASTTTPIQHLVVIFDENISFDHYFGTYPNAANPVGEPGFTAKKGTPTVNGLSTALLTNNPNLSNPQRLDRSQAVTCDQDHGYLHEQQAVDMGAADLYVQKTNRGGVSETLGQCLGDGATPGNYAVMDYYDGNTVTALWNYAQRFAMSDNSYTSNYGPSTPGALDVIDGQTYGALCGPTFAVFNTSGACPAFGVTPTLAGSPVPLAAGQGTMFSDADPYFDVCANNGISSQMAGATIGDSLSSKGTTWGFFTGGFADPGYVPGNPATDTHPGNVECHAGHANVAGSSTADYIPHHEPFQYFRSTANPDHLPPTSIAAIGHQDQANHQYDVADFFAAVSAGNMPAVSYLKAPAFQDGHAGYSDPLDEQHFLVNTINTLQKSKEWKSTAVVVAYDDSDGWYDHVVPPVVTQSQTVNDALTGPGQCGNGSVPGQVPVGPGGILEQNRCGYGVRVPLLVISPFSRQNFVDHAVSDQSSVVRFIEDNWMLPRLGGGSDDSLAGSLTQMLDFTKADRNALILDPSTGEPMGRSRKGH
jgi:phospholipase C